MWSSVEPFLSKVSFLTFHLSSPSHFSLLILDCNVFPSLCIFVRNSSLLHLYDVMDLSLPSLFPFSFSGFSFLFFNFCPFFSSFVHYLPFQPPPLSFLSCRFPSTLFTLLYTSFINPSPHPCHHTSPPPVLLILLPLPPALVDWAWDLRHDLCSGSARLRAHWDHKQLPHPDKVMDNKKVTWLTQSGNSFSAKWLYTDTETSCSALITGWVRMSSRSDSTKVTFSYSFFF